MMEISGLEELHRWVINTNDAIQANRQLIFLPQTVKQVADLAAEVAENVSSEYSLYADRLPRLVKNAFSQSMDGMFTLNPAGFGELCIIIEDLMSEPQNVFPWSMIHPRIAATAKELFLDGYYSSAVYRSFIEVESRLRELFMELMPGEKPPREVGEIIEALFSEEGAYHTTTQSGKNYLKGIKSLLEGSISAFGNPIYNENSAVSKEDAFEQIVVASMLMKMLDKEAE